LRIAALGGNEKIDGYYFTTWHSDDPDQRSWDNMGFEENTAAPGDFDPNTCFAHKSLGPENNEP